MMAQPRITSVRLPNSSSPLSSATPPASAFIHSFSKVYDSRLGLKVETPIFPHPCGCREDGPMDRVECVVIGAGVVGLALARHLAIQGREVVVLEAEDRIGTGISSRNSEVIHAGIYYPKGSLKARLCVAGKGAL